MKKDLILEQTMIIAAILKILHFLDRHDIREITFELLRSAFLVLLLYA